MDHSNYSCNITKKKLVAHSSDRADSNQNVERINQVQCVGIYFTNKWTS